MLERETTHPTASPPSLIKNIAGSLTVGLMVFVGMYLLRVNIGFSVLALFGGESTPEEFSCSGLLSSTLVGAVTGLLLGLYHYWSVLRSYREAQLEVLTSSADPSN